MKVEEAEELWDRYSRHVGDDISSLDAVAGTSVIFRTDFIKAVTESTGQRMFTETEIAHLQSKVHEITGNGEVMRLFNTLLGVNAG